jgi:hypothetical protein
MKVKKYENNNQTKNSNWIKLENISAVSALVTSHVSGLQGLESGLWLQNIFRELEFIRLILKRDFLS